MLHGFPLRYWRQRIGCPFTYQRPSFESLAKRRLADEYDAAQQRGEVAKAGDPRPSTAEGLPTAADVGLSHKEIHEARLIRDAAQDRGEVAASGQYSRSNAEHLSTAAEIGLNRKDIHEARLIRDAEQDRGKVAAIGANQHTAIAAPTQEKAAADIGLNRKDIHEARFQQQ